MSLGHVSAAAVWTGERLELVGGREAFGKAIQRLKLVAGEALTVRVEREADAWRHGDVKGLFGYVYKPVEDYTGIWKTELHVIAKGLYLPDDGRTSITELNREEFQDFKRATEEWLREEVWEAFEKFDEYNYMTHRARRVA